MARIDDTGTMGREVIGETVRLQFAQHPDDGDTCVGCGAGAVSYVKHPRLVGGTCSACGRVWLPSITFHEATPLYADDVRVTTDDDGGATITFPNG